MKIVFFSAVVSLFIALGVSAASPAVEFYNRKRTVEILDAKYNAWISANHGKVALREQLKKDYVDTFRRSFDGTDVWIFSNFMNDTVIKNTMSYLRNDYNLVLNFFNEVQTTFKRSYLHRIRRADEEGDKDAVKLIQLSRQRESQIAEKFNTTIHRLTTEEWRRQFPIDVGDFLRARQMSRTIHSDLRNYLDKKYPFRQWMVLVHSGSEDSWSCPGGSFFVYHNIFPDRDVIVTQLEHSVKVNRNRATDWLTRIPDRKYDLICSSRSRAIVGEATSDCSGSGVPFFGVFAHGKFGPPAIAVSKPQMLTTKISRRASLIFCEQYYTVAIFG